MAVDLRRIEAPVVNRSKGAPEEEDNTPEIMITVAEEPTAGAGSSSSVEIEFEYFSRWPKEALLLEIKDTWEFGSTINLQISVIGAPFVKPPTFSLLFLELAVARVFTLLNLCPNAQARLHLFPEKLVGRNKREEMAPIVLSKALEPAEEFEEEDCDRDLTAKKFYKAEEYHQHYLSKGGKSGHAQSPSKSCKDPISCFG
ncbi:hypothetical protein DY000_02055375 [Brassica cretica]|uniref:Peptide-methionine (S)-S-oxide reductase n=1 Tax=Brassica cretica TaxID=69181 RepID=A0ABQ7A975_BRACR|nr:hypothetical protein DY000_02055375 [Brassica cretica]